MVIVSRRQPEGGPYETLPQECTIIVSAGIADRHEAFLAGPPFSDSGGRSDTRWRGRFLAFAAVLMAWDSSHTLGDRFDSARQTLSGMFPSRKRVGQTYQGFIKAMLGLGEAVGDRLTVHLRGVLRRMAGAYWRRGGFIAFAADGSRVDCPRSEANGQALGCGGRKGSAPQF